MEEKELGYYIKHINKHMKCRGDEALRKYDLTISQLHVLFVLFQNDGALNQKDLEQILHVSHPTTVGLVKRLEKKGYLKTKVNPNDKRNKIVEITQKAKTLDKQLRKDRKENEKRLLKNLTEKEIKQLKRLLGKVLEIEGGVHENINKKCS